MLYRELARHHPGIAFELTEIAGPPRQAVVRFGPDVPPPDRAAVQQTLADLTAGWATEDATAVADQQAAQADRADRAQLVQQLQSDLDRLTDTGASLTLAQTRPILARVIRAQLLLIRMATRRNH